MKLDDPSGFAEFVHDILKIFHVRTHHHRLAGQEWLGWILSAHSVETLADDNNGRRGIPVPEFSGAVYEQNGGILLKIRVGTQSKLDVAGS